MVAIAKQWREGQTAKSNKNDKLYAVQIAKAYVSRLTVAKTKKFSALKHSTSTEMFMGYVIIAVFFFVVVMN